MQTIKIDYHSVKRFRKDISLFSAAKIYLAGKKLAPPGTRLSIEITLPDIEKVFYVKGKVAKHLRKQTSQATPGKPHGMLISMTDGFDAMYAELVAELNRHKEYKKVLAAIRKQDNALSREWIRDAISQAEQKIEEDIEPEVLPPPRTTKKELSLAERVKVQSIADFILNMIKTMLRSGYYDPDHPASKEAKDGLFSEFQKHSNELKEIMISKEESNKSIDFIITGVLDEPVSLRNVVGLGKADLFIPKLAEYFDRKSLISLAIKKEITSDHFEAFIDIMCDPKGDRSKDDKVGDTLTKAMVSKGVNGITAVFMDDMIALESNLPWRVEMAIHRLAKDLKMLPMFEGSTVEGIRAMKIQIVEDILRPLRHPHLLADIVINCYVIAMHVEDLDAHDLERTIINAFPFSILLPASRFIFNEMEDLITEQKELPDNKILKRRLAAVKRILKWTAKRVVVEKVPEAQKFLERLYFDDIISYDELPPEVQYHINTLKLAKDVRDNLKNYIEWIHNAKTEDDITVLLRCFKRVSPFLIDHEAWQTLFEVMKHVSQKNLEFTEKLKLGCSPIIYIFQEDTDHLAEIFESAEEDKREAINQFFALLGQVGIVILTRILEKSEKGDARLAAANVLSTQKEQARSWVNKVLDDKQNPWFLHRNALLILCSVGEGEDDIARMRKYVRHQDPRVRLEALKAAVALAARDTEALLIKGLQDREDMVRKQALLSLRELAIMSEESIATIISLVEAEQPKDRDDFICYCGKNTMLIRALGVMKKPPLRKKIEQTLLQLIREQCRQGNILNIIKRKADEDINSMISASLFTLTRQGNAETISSLDELALISSPYSELIEKVIRDRELTH